MEKKDLLKDTIKHIDIKSYDSTQLIDAMRGMSFTSRDTARATDILMMMVGESVLIFLPLPEVPVLPDVCRFTWTWFVTKWLTW